MSQYIAPETFVTGEWVEFCHGATRRAVQITAVSENEVTARVLGQPMVFAPRSSDGRYIKLGSLERETLPAMIFHAQPTPVKKQSRLKDIRDFLHGMFWGSGL